MAVAVMTLDGRRIVGPDALAVVRELNSTALVNEPDAWRYMVQASKRVRELRGVTVRSSSAEAFLHDMAAAGFLELETDAESETDADPETDAESETDAEPDLS